MNRHCAAACILLGIMPAPWGTAAPVLADVEILPTAGRTVYRLAVAKIGADGGPLLLGSTYDNRLCAWDVQGRLR